MNIPGRGNSIEEASGGEEFGILEVQFYWYAETKIEHKHASGVEMNS